MSYSKAELKSSGSKASACIGPFWIGKVSDKYLSIHILLCITSLVIGLFEVYE
jgi:hypothetical protein